MTRRPRGTQAQRAAARTTAAHAKHEQAEAALAEMRLLVCWIDELAATDASLWDNTPTTAPARFVAGSAP